MGPLTRSGGTAEATGPDRTSEPGADVERHRAPAAGSPVPTVPVAVVWLDAAAASIVHWVDGPVVDRLTSDVPNHHRSTGHLRHDPAVRHGGGGPATDLIDRDRAEHRRAFVRQVAGRIPGGSSVWILGPGGTRDELAAQLRADDRRQGHPRPVVVEPSGPLTERQLIARFRELSGIPPRRRVVGRH